MASTRIDFPPIRACLFDMDGLLINSEDLYTICTNTVLREHGRPDLPWSIKAQLQGRPGPSASQIFQEWAKLPMDSDAYMVRLKELQTKHFPTCAPLPGVETLLANLAHATTTTSPSSKVHIALATSSHAGNYKLKTDHMQELFAVFPERQKVLGDDVRIAPGRGKPLPDIYYLALDTINEGIRERNAVPGAEQEKEITPEECLVFEDSVPGVEAGRRAGMRVVWCPHEGLFGEYAGREEEVLAGATGSHAGEDEKAVEEAKKRAGFGVAGWPGKKGDGWGDYYKSLEDFPYEKYGIKV